MANGIVEGSNILVIGDQEIELKKLTLGNLETLEKEFGSIEKALSTMKGIATAIWLVAKRSGYRGKLDDIKDAIEFDQIQSVIGAIANQRTLVLSAQEAQSVETILSSALVLEENEDAKGFILDCVKKDKQLLEGVQARAKALGAVRGEA